jgi:hypothetical protein
MRNSLKVPKEGEEEHFIGCRFRTKGGKKFRC